VTFSDYQSAAARTINPGLDQRERLADAAAGLAEEAGEALAIVRKHLYQGAPLDPPRIAEELGDVVWCVAALATVLGLSLEDIARGNLDKLARRHPGRLER
jgi:NTP pyrophosphatase (non-canonical NTP hydrolase)